MDIDPFGTDPPGDLRYVSGDEPGYRRRRCGRGFVYYDPKGEVVRNADVRQRLKSLVVPPAWTDVWICADEDGHIQATGRDERGRKQYRYHPDWQSARSEAKFYRLSAFGKALPELRRCITRDLRKHGLVREKVLAAVISTLERTLIRIGNEAYARTNNSFGLTTLRDHHVECTSTSCSFVFRGKSRKMREVTLNDRRLARIIRLCQDLPGQHLFQYVDDEGAIREVDSADVNEYLREAMGGRFSAKDFRTWGGSLEAAVTLAAMDRPESERGLQKKVVEMIRHVASVLGNTTAICRDYYIHPSIIESFMDGSFTARWDKARDMPGHEDLAEEESALLHFLVQAERNGSVG
jgi:DNA topoisomerase I